MTNPIWLLLFLLVPFIVHLFNFRRAKRVAFTNVRFIQQASSETKSKTRLKHILILTVRCFVFFLLAASVYFFLQPYDKVGQIGESVEPLLYQDNSLSAYTQAYAYDGYSIESLLSQEQFRSAYLLTNDFASFANSPKPQSELIDYASQIDVSYVERPLLNILKRANQLSNTVTLVSDFQLANSDDFDFIKSDTNTTYQLVLNTLRETANVFIDTVWVSRDLEDYSYNILTCVLNVEAPNSNLPNVVVKLLTTDGAQISSVVVDLSSDKKVSFTIPRGQNHATYMLQVSGDDLNYDNKFYLTASSNEIPSILLLSREDNSYLTSVFDNEELFDFVNLSSDAIDYEILDDMDLILLNGYRQLPQGLIDQHINDANFVIIPSDSIILTNYTKETGFDLSYSPSGNTPLALKDNLFLRGVFDKMSDDVNMPNGSVLLQILRNMEPIIVQRTGAPFLVRHLNQPIYMFASPLTDAFTQLPSHAIFLPIMYRIAESSIDALGRLYYYPNDYIELPVLIGETPIKLVAENYEIIPEFASGNNTTVIKIPSDIPPGFYHFVRNEDTLRSISINLPKSESLRPSFSPDEIKSFFEETSHVSVLEVEEVGDVLYAEANQIDLWKYALALALFFLAIETALHRYFQ